MRDCPLQSKRTAWILLTGLLLAVYAVPAEAHKMNVFAHADGRSISGEVYVRGGAPIKAARVTAFDPAGKILAETITDDAGEFTFELKFRCDHRIVVDTGDGHSAEYTVGMDELPADLPPQGPILDHVLPVSSPSTPKSSPDSVNPATRSSARDESLHDRIAAIDRQLKELRKDLDKYQSQLRIQDIVGAIGYILGLMGLAYYLGASRKDKREKDR
jgi:nickel transport protein